MRDLGTDAPAIKVGISGGQGGERRWRACSNLPRDHPHIPSSSRSWCRWSTLVAAAGACGSFLIVGSGAVGAGVGAVGAADLLERLRDRGDVEVEVEVDVDVDVDDEDDEEDIDSEVAVAVAAVEGTTTSISSAGTNVARRSLIMVVMSCGVTSGVVWRFR